MVAARLLRLYPRAWRDRYAEEFLAMIGPAPIRAQQAIDIVSGAIDAWLSPDVRRASAAASGGGSMTKMWTVCERTPVRYTVRDGLIAAAVMLVATMVLTTLGIAARRGGSPVTGGVLKDFAFVASLTLSMPFWITKGQPWKAQAAIVGVTLTFIVLIGYFG